MYCAIYQRLLDESAAASERYHDAISELNRLTAVPHTAGAFAKVKEECQLRRRDCRRQAEAMREHRDNHGCYQLGKFVPPSE
jgi:hypothetical protein